MNNLLAKDYRLKRGVVVLAVFFGLTSLLTGCEPLRKKFVRKKKDSKKKEFIPVLDPVDYPAKVETPDELYRYHYSMWQIWQKDLVTSLDGHSSDKKMRYLVNQVTVHLQEMSQLVVGEKQKEAQKFLRQMRGIEEEINKPQAMRNNPSLKRQMLIIGKDIRRKLKTGEVQEFLVSK